MIEDLAQKRNLPIRVATLVVETIFEEISLALEKGQRVEIRGFGSFELRKYKGYKGRNPQNKKIIQVKPKKLPFFRVGTFKVELNKG